MEENEARGAEAANQDGEAQGLTGRRDALYVKGERNNGQH